MNLMGLAGMNDVLPKPFTKDSLLGMLEKHLLHMKKMQQLQLERTPTPLKTPQITEFPTDQETRSTTSVDGNPSSSVSLDDPSLQFSYDQDYSAIFGTPENPSFTQNDPSSSTGKRRAGSDRDHFEYTEQPRSVPRSNGGTTGGGGEKRVRYNTPPW